MVVMAKGKRRRKKASAVRKFTATQVKAFKHINRTPRQDLSQARRMHRDKISYPTLEVAQAKAAELNRMIGLSLVGYEGYGCLYCPSFHVGGAYIPERSGRTRYAHRHIQRGLVQRLIWALGDLIESKEVQDEN